MDISRLVIVLILFLLLYLFFMLKELIMSRIISRKVSIEDFHNWNSLKINFKELKVINGNFYQDKESFASPRFSFWALVNGNRFEKNNELVIHSYITYQTGKKQFQSPQIKLDQKTVEILLEKKQWVYLYKKNDDIYHFDISFLYE